MKAPGWVASVLAVVILSWAVSVPEARAGWEWQNPLPQGNTLRAVWGSSGTDVYAAGDHGTILHYDGVDWSLIDTGTEKPLRGLWGSGAGNVYAVGDEGTVLRYNGAHWAKVSAGTTKSLRAIWGSGPTDVFAVGDEGTILHFDGSNWTPMASGTSNVLHCVWGSGSDDVYAGGDDGLILHYDGTNWAPSVHFQNNHSINGIWGSGRSDVFSVDGLGVILHYDGASWSTGNYYFFPTLDLYGIWGSGPNDVFAVSYTGMILHYDGICWSDSVSPVSNRQIYGVWGSAANDVFAVGAGGTLLHYDGLAWTKMSAGPGPRLHKVWGGARDDIYAVGLHGAILHYDGVHWRALSSGVEDHLDDIWGSGPNDVFAVGGSPGKVLHYDGTGWRVVHSSAVGPLFRVWGAGPNDVYVLGSRPSNQALMLHYDGSTWSAVDLGTSTPLEDLWGSGPEDLFAVGWDGTILHFDGEVWTRMTSGTQYWLTGIWGSGPNDVYAFGSGIVLHYDGMAWNQVLEGFSPLGMWGSGPNDVFAVGEGILHFDGANWTRMPSRTSNLLVDVWGSGPDDVIAVGDYGTVLHFDGSHVQEKGSLSVTIDPGEAVAAGARWRVDGVTWLESGDTASGLAIGEHTVEYKDVAGWVKPSNQVVSIAEEQTVTLRGAYEETGFLEVTFDCPGGYTGVAAYRVDKGPWYYAYWAPPFNLAVGAHTIEFKEVDGWIKPPDQVFTLEKGQTTTITAIYTLKPVIRVLRPGSGETISAGSSAWILWDHAGDPGPLVNIELHKAGAVVATLASDIPIGKGSLSCIIPIGAAPGTDYRISITSTSNASCVGLSNGYVTITVPPPIKVLAPNGGEKWEAGSVHEIHWAWEGVPAQPAIIQLCKGGAVVATVTPEDPTSRRFPWIVPANVPPGDDYSIRVTSGNAPSYSDTSDAAFTITDYQLLLVHPNGGEILPAGGTQTISWKHRGDPRAKVDIMLWKGGTLKQFIAMGVPMGARGVGSYRWRLDPSLEEGTDYTIMVVGDGSDMSDAPFTIARPTLEVTAPAAGESWQAGSTGTVSWVHRAIPHGASVRIELLKGGRRVRVIAPRAPVGPEQAGAFTWKIPRSLKPGEDYGVRVTSLTDPSCTDLSEGTFRISTTAQTGVTAP